MTWLTRFWRRRPAPSSQWVWRQIAALPDPPELFHADGRGRRARLTRPGFDKPDLEKLSLRKKPAGQVLRMERRQ